MSTPPARNRLASETSPYLLQHANNPVHWQPWDGGALGQALRENKPILLSVGYSACHWCHVMAHESFEDGETAKLMNELFVNIKVDREERPDLDQIYQLAHQMLTQRPGGWPLTMFLTPDAQVPFFGGTYFPPEARHGMPGFGDVLQRVNQFFRTEGEQIASQGEAVLEAFRHSDPQPATGAELNGQPIEAARQALLAEFDVKHGGFGGAPKFPGAGMIDLLLRHWHAQSHQSEPDLQSLYMATFSLQQMARGGLYDHIGGGFYRYSVDERWEIPHFEKMLYDNAPLLALYAQAYQATGERLFWRVANETADYVLREMTAPEGGFYATQDADSEGGEGAFYAWSKEEFDAVLGADAKEMAGYFSLDKPANFEERWHLNVDGEAAKREEEDGFVERLAAARAKLFAAREGRPRPGRDEKVLTGWNGQMIRSLAIAGRVLERDDLVEAAARAAGFVRERLWHEQRLLATFKDGRARFMGYLDDYAFMLDGVLELVQARFDLELLNFAVELADALLEHFADRQDGGFFFTADDHEALLHRMKPFSDDATPAGNGVAARALLRLGYLLGHESYLHSAEAAVRAAWDPVNRVPHAHASLLNGLEEIVQPTECVVIRAPEEDLPAWLAPTRSYAPRRLVVAIPNDLIGLPGALAERKQREGGVAYVCKGSVCGLPLESAQQLLTALTVKNTD